MPSRSQQQTYIRGDGSKALTFYEQLSWVNSPRDVYGKLQLRSNPMTHVRGRLLSNTATGTYPTGSADNVAAIKGYGWFSAAETTARQKAYGRFRGKLMDGSASLGVTFASMRQSRDMIEKRSHAISSSAEMLETFARRDLHRAVSKKAADAYLETIFGWVPLLTDIHASSMTVIQQAIPPEYVKASATEYVNNREYYNRPGWHTQDLNYSGTVSCKYAATVRVVNPNMWLANRAGLLNPAAVAWDLVPWSFVINMVTNIGSLVNSISDFYGLTFENASTTIKWSGGRTVSWVNTYPGKWSTHSSDASQGKWRTVGAPAYPKSFQSRAPELSWSTAATAAALMVQKTRSVGSLLGNIIPHR